MTLLHIAKEMETKRKLSVSLLAKHLVHSENGIQTQAVAFESLHPIPKHDAAFQGDSREQIKAEAARPKS